MNMKLVIIKKLKKDTPQLLIVLVEHLQITLFSFNTMLWIEFLKALCYKNGCGILLLYKRMNIPE